MRLEAVVMFPKSGLPEGVGPLEIKLSILKAVKNKFNGEYKYNLLPSAELHRRGPVENYLDTTFDDDMRHLAGMCFDQLREADLIRSTHSSNQDRENWVKITERGLKALESGKIDQDQKLIGTSTEIHIKFAIPVEAVFDAQLGKIVPEIDLVSCLFLDLDNFKSVNDNYDHNVGDQVIVEAIAVVQATIKGKGELFHRSGDELLVLLPNFNEAEAISTGERIRKAIKAHPFSTIGTGVITATIGVSTYPTSCNRVEDLKVTADRAAMKAKKLGKDVVVHSGSLERDSGGSA